MSELVLYAYPFRSRAERVLWTLRELQLPHRVVRLDPFKGETGTAEFVAMNPGRKLPVLTHGTRVLTESLAIMEYLNDISEANNLVPLGVDANYDFRQRLHYGLTEIEPYLWVADQGTRLQQYYPWPTGSDVEALRQVRRNLRVVWKWLEHSPHLAGEHFSLADIYYYQLITWAARHGIEVPEVVDLYLRQLETRPAFPTEMRM